MSRRTNNPHQYVCLAVYGGERLFGWVVSGRTARTVASDPAPAPCKAYHLGALDWAHF